MSSDRIVAIMRWAIVGLSVVGLGIATYLTISHINGSAPACGASGGCEVVTTSEHAVFLGVPVSVIGMAGYSVLLLGNLAILGIQAPHRTLTLTLLLLAVLGALFSAYLVSVQVIFIGGFCLYCVGSATVMTSILALTIAAGYARSRR